MDIFKMSIFDFAKKEFKNSEKILPDTRKVRRSKSNKKSRHDKKR